MQVSSLQTINELLKQNTKSSQGQTVFDDFYQAAMSKINETNELDKKANQAAIDFVTGKNDNVADLMIAQEKASIALQYTVSIRNKVLEAYNEIMRIQL